MYLNKKVIPIPIKLLANLVILLYVTAVILDVTLGMSTEAFVISIKYAAVLFCVLISLLIRELGEDRKDTMLLTWALLFTAAGDLFLVIMYKPILGVLCFTVVQGLYIIRYGRKSKINKGFALILLSLYIGVFFALYLQRTVGGKNLILSAGMIYAAILLTSVFVSMHAELYEKRIKYTIVTGMILFLFCDVCVGITYVFHNYSIFSNQINIVGVSSVLIWIFYIPSQLLLALSGYKYECIKGIFNLSFKTN